jgi:methylmalonyl-CoA mutase N-terminal domain/subunit
VTRTADPLGGSYYVEALTGELEREAESLFAEIAGLGGMLAAVERGYFRRKIAESASRFQREVDARERIIVGVNEFVEPDSRSIETHAIDRQVEPAQRECLRRIRETRDAAGVEASLNAIREAAASNTNLMPALLEASHRRATVGEMMRAMQEVFGTCSPGRDG